MKSTIVADHLESVLLEIQYASRDIANQAANQADSRAEIDESLLEALETARKVLEDALGIARMNGVPRLAIDAG